MSPEANGVPNHFLVIVPGFLGSKLRSRTTDETVWIDFSTIPANPLQWDDWVDNLLTTMTYPNDELEPAGLVDEVVFVLPWVKQEHYGRLFDALTAMGYKANPEQYSEAERDVYAFPYDWRQDNRLSARELAKAIDRWRGHHLGAEAWIIAHSNGGLVARWYIEEEGGKDYVGRLFLMGAPWDGTPVAMYVLQQGLDYLFRRRFNPYNLSERTRDVLRSFPSLYQLIPVQDRFLRDAAGRRLSPFSDVEWLTDSKHKQLLLAGRKLADTLGDRLSVETLCFFGRKQFTTSYGVITLEGGQQLSEVKWYADEAGDGTIPERSAIHPRADQKLPFVVDHGDIYVNPAVLEFLQWELRDKYVQPRAIVTLPTLRVLFEPERDVYAPGETIAMKAVVAGPEGETGQRAPVENATIDVELAWKDALPGDAAEPAALVAARGALAPAEVSGEYAGQLQAPEQEGYYQLRGVVSVPGRPPVELSELVLIEAVP